jgi:predicted enzyme related to lactoylglutathione lyase
MRSLDPFRHRPAAVAATLMAISFVCGFSINTFHSHQEETPTMKKVTGIGGIFFKCKDPKKMKEWYHTHLGLNTNDYGATFEWREDEDPNHKGSTTWSPFSENTKYFEPSTKDHMINYRVADLEALVVQLKAEGVTIVDSIESYDYGKFVHILDAEGNKVELWEPKD